MFAENAYKGCMNDADVRKLMDQKVKEAGTLRAWARKHKVSPSYASDVWLGRRTIGPKILKALGLEVISSHTTYRKIRP